MLLFIKQATLYNYADDNTLASFSKAMSDLVGIVEKETGVALSWLELNKMIAKINQWKNKSNASGGKFNINGKIINSEETLKLRAFPWIISLTLTLICQIFAEKLQHN